MSLYVPTTLLCVSRFGRRFGVPLGLGALLFFVPLVPFNFIYIEGLPFVLTSSIRFFPFLLALVASVWGLIIILNDPKVGYEVVSTPLFLIILCIGVIFLGVFSSVEFIQSSIRAIYFVFTGEVLCLLAALTLRNRKTILWLLGIHMLSAVLVSIYGLSEKVFWHFWLTEVVFSADNHLLTRFGGGRPFEQTEKAIATVGNPNILGAYLSFCSPFFLCFFLNFKRKSIKIGTGFCYILLVVLLFFTFSRGAWIGFGFCMVIFLWRNYRVLTYIFVVSMFLIFGWATANLKVNNTYEELIVHFEHKHRPQSYAIATQIWINQPFWGTGSGAYRFFSKPLGSQNDTPDNMYLLMLAENGILGLGLRLSIFAYIICLYVQSNIHLKSQLHRSNMTSDLNKTADINIIRAFMASMIGFLVNILSFDGLQFPVNRISFWIIIGLGLAFVRVSCAGIWVQSLHLNGEKRAD
jgi:hypothetical protein